MKMDVRTLLCLICQVQDLAPTEIALIEAATEDAD